MKKLLPVLCGLLLAYNQPSPASAAPPKSGAGAPRCSASTLSPKPKPSKPALPAKVESMRRRIIAAAVAALSVEQGKEFSLGSSGETDLAAFWRKKEQQGDPVLARLVRVLNLPYTGEGEHYLWPSAASMFRKAKDWEALKGLYPPETIARWKGSEKGYMGLRTGIHLNGDWLFAMSEE